MNIFDDVLFDSECILLRYSFRKDLPKNSVSVLPIKLLYFSSAVFIHFEEDFLISSINFTCVIFFESIHNM